MFYLESTYLLDLYMSWGAHLYQCNPIFLKQKSTRLMKYFLFQNCLENKNSKTKGFSLILQKAT